MEWGLYKNCVIKIKVKSLPYVCVYSEHESWRYDIAEWLSYPRIRWLMEEFWKGIKRLKCQRMMNNEDLQKILIIKCSELKIIGNNNSSRN